MRLVRFEDGTFGVRRWSFFMFQYVYHDFKYDCLGKGYWWPRKTRWFLSDCRTTEQQARAFLDKGTPIN